MSPRAPGWEERTAESGEVYYVNHTTKKTSRERPVNPPVAVSPRGPAASTEYVEPPLSPGETLLYLDTAPIYSTLDGKDYSS